jgi:hypothetical protein
LFFILKSNLLIIYKLINNFNNNNLNKVIIKNKAKGTFNNININIKYIK